MTLDLSNNKLGRVFDEYASTLKSKGTRHEIKPMFSNLFFLKELNLCNNEIKVISSSVFINNL
jgi:hypothetical protein